MSYFETYNHRAQFVGPHADLITRIADFLEAGSRQLPRRLEALRRAVEGRVKSIDLRESLQSLISQLRARPPIADSPALDTEWLALSAQIKAHGEGESIEGYAAFLFPVHESGAGMR